ncbi:sigma-54-dependent Fis family transcriptional regulator [Chondromyces crocatus]|uniref:Fis family transcriptional regulator n=1 Tax=Chondromyces crocatus TaxID=52 RepID=A0A0K1EE49_CHOCO|nr:sigma-54-dependent Fis family transcriptional regulator [Chondromyces crocatus]AKT39119.1 uncharacterized protein CMC5_032660 [Chondromyces crocatus]
MHPRDDTQGPLEIAVFAAGGVTRHALPAQGSLSLGRSEENDVRIDDSSVSRRHAVIHVGPPLRIEDLGSANGTRLRRELDAQETAKLLDTRIQRGTAVEFKLGDPINLGSTLVVVRRREPRSVTSSGDGKWEPIVRDEAMVKLYALAERVASAPLSVLLLGETGSGKEVLAEHVHRSSPRAAGPFLRLNCAALSESLLESELFGHEKGAFTSAVRSKPGLLETAEKGTVFLDEVGELPASIQVKLLRVLEDRQVTRVGGLSPRPIDVRFVSATNRDLAHEVKKGAFREDLFFRLNGIALTIPPLRARLNEIEPLVRTFVGRAASALGREAPDVAAETIAALKGHRWPGNVRELRNVIDRAVVLSGGDTVLSEHLLLDSGAAVTPAPAPVSPTVPGIPEGSSDAGGSAGDGDGSAGDLRAQLSDLERRRILDALEKCAGNQTQAAALLGMPRRTFVARLTAYGIPRPRKKPG